jgi:hypothetical protein
MREKEEGAHRVCLDSGSPELGLGLLLSGWGDKTWGGGVHSGATYLIGREEPGQDAGGWEPLCFPPFVFLGRRPTGLPHTTVLLS